MKGIMSNIKSNLPSWKLFVKEPNLIKATLAG